MSGLRRQQAILAKMETAIDAVGRVWSSSGTLKPRSRRAAAAAGVQPEPPGLNGRSAWRTAGRMASMRRRLILAGLLALVVLGSVPPRYRRLGAADGRLQSLAVDADRLVPASALEPAVGRIVVIDPPPGAVAAGWPAGVPLIKPVAAVAGIMSAVAGVPSVLVNGKRAGRSDAPGPAPGKVPHAGTR